MKKTTWIVKLSIAVVLIGILIAVIGVVSNNDRKAPSETISTETTEVGTENTEHTGTSGTESSSTAQMDTDTTEIETGTNETETQHTHDYKSVITDATCTAQGYTTYTCSVCNYTYKSSIEMAKGHFYSDWVTIIAPTCETDGRAERNCATCGNREERELSAYGHQYDYVLNENDETVLQCRICLIIIDVADSNTVTDKWEEHHVIPTCDEVFSFYVITDKGEQYIYDNLIIADMSSIGSLAELSIAVVGDDADNSNIDFTVTAADDAPNTWLVEATAGYAPYNTYVAHISGELLFKDYNTDTLVFSVEGADRENIVFNEDNMLFLKDMENNSPGYYPYTVIYDENAEKYYVSVSKGDAFDENCIGMVLCVGDYASCDEILEDSSRELYFGKIESIWKNENGGALIVLSSPDLGDIYDCIEYSGSEIADMSGFEDSDEVKRAVRSAFINSDSFAQMVASANIAAASYAADNGYEIEPLSAKSLKDSIKIDANVKKNNKNGVTGTIKATLSIDLKVKGEVVGKIQVACEAQIDIDIEVKVDFTSEKKGEETIDFKNFSFTLTNTNAITFDFSCKIIMDYSEATPEFVVNNTSGVIHTPSCRYYTNSQHIENYREYSLKTLLEADGVKSLDDLKSRECSVCKAISRSCRASFAVNTSTNKVHCLNCIHVKNASSNLKYVSALPTGNKYSYCVDCKPQNITLDDFETYMADSLNSESWSAQLNTVKSYMKELSDPGDDVRHTLITVPINLSIITVEVSVDFVLDFNLQATLDYHNEKIWVNQVYIKRVGGEYICGNNPDESGSNSSQSLDMMGRMELRIGGALEVRVGFTGLTKVCYIGFTVEAGLYVDVRGILHASSQNNEFDSVYYAAYFETGIYSEADFDIKIFWWDKNFSIHEKKYPLLFCGYDRVYYQFSEYDRAVNITNGKTSIDSLDILEVDYIFLPDLTEKSTELSATGKSGHYTVSYSFINPDGSKNNYISVQGGYLVIDDAAPDEFTVTMIVTIEGYNDVVNTFYGLAALDREKGTVPPAFFLKPYSVTLNIKAAKELEYTSNGDGTCYVSGIGTCTDPDIVIPRIHNGERVVAIAQYAFFYCTQLKSVIIPDSITNIGEYAFAYCSGIESIIVPNSVTNIGEEAFYNCTELKYVTIPNTIRNIGDLTFEYCNSLETVTFNTPYYTLTIPSYWFGKFVSETVNENDRIYHIYFSEKISADEGYPGSIFGLYMAKQGDEFYNPTAQIIKSFIFDEQAYNIWVTTPTDFDVAPDGIPNYRMLQEDMFFVLESLELKDIVTDITSNTYPDGDITNTESVGLEYTSNRDGTCYVSGIGTCTDTDIVIPTIAPNGNSVTSIGYGAFANCYDLESIVIPDSVTIIGDYAFACCDVLERIVIHDSVTSIGYGAFAHCDSLTSITVDENNEYYKSIDGNLYSKDGTTLIQYAIGKTATSFTIPDSVTSIGDYAFYDCSCLTSITIPDSVTIIGDYAFTCCDVLERIVIPDSVTSIGVEAFADCSSLTSITIPDSVTSIDDGAFSWCTSLTSIIIPDSVTSIGEFAFFGCSFTTVYYTGSEEEWAALSIGSSNSYLTNATIVYNYVSEE
ncbi:MAG: leucine-rich repeat domain-containing protein [Clostridia bacterium]|nr:leucine-rich repeat domain-containing protein [Clostridia bacterium]